MNKYSVAVVGGGPGGYVTAIRLKQYNIDVAVFEKERLGGVCLNHGCIPTKALVKNADLVSEIKNSAEFGITTENLQIDFPKIMKRKGEVTDKLVSGVEFIFKKRKIPVIDENVKTILKDGEKYKILTSQNEYLADYVILTTGSIPKELPSLKFDGKNILSSRDILQISELPKKLVVIGGGVIGCEFASIFNQLGTEVEIVEFLPKLIFNEDNEISKRLAMALKKSGIKLHLKSYVEKLEVVSDKVKLILNTGKQITADKVLLSVGRIPNLSFQFDEPDLTDKNGFIKIDENFQTSAKNVFAVGDITGKLMLAHTASKQGLIVADILDNLINGKKHKLPHIEYANVPRCTFTNPEIGSIGLTEETARKKYGEILVGKFPFTANGKALGLGETFGFVKVIAAAESKKIVGMHIIGPQATELIAQGAILIGMQATFEDVRNIVFAHPTLSESTMEAIEDLEKLAIHKL